MDSDSASLIEKALIEGKCKLSSTGALVSYSGKKTGRSPKDKRIVKNKISENIWWSKVNIPISDKLFEKYTDYAVKYLSDRLADIYVVSAYAGWDPKYRVGVRVYSTNIYHSIFMKNMLVGFRNEEEKINFKPEIIIYNMGHIPLSEVKIKSSLRDESLSDTLIALKLGKKKCTVLIYGTEYAGEMKKAILTYMMWKMPTLNHLTLHSSANVSKSDLNNVTFFFGLSGCGKTSLSTDERFLLVGDDEHVWTPEGIFNIEGGCYAKCIGLRKDKEPEIFQAIRFGAVLENVIMNEETRIVDYEDISITPNTRASYPLNHVKDVVIPAIAPHPKQIIFLVCDAFGLLPPVALLTPEQAVFFFIAGYTSKIPGTEVGVKVPIPTFSSCFGEPFLIWSPSRYGELLKEKIEKYKCPVYLLNTGWVDGEYGVGKRIPIEYSKKMVKLISEGGFDNYEDFPIFNLKIPTDVPGVPNDILNPLKTTKNKDQYLKDLNSLYDQFKQKLRE